MLLTELFPPFDLLNWILGVIPRWVPWAIILIGLVVYSLEKGLEKILPSLFKDIPILYRTVISIFSIILMSGGFYLDGRQDILVNGAKEAQKTEAKQAAVTQQSATSFNKTLATIGQTHEDIKKTITTSADSDCSIPVTFVRLHNSAAKGVVPDTSSPGNGSPPATRTTTGK